MDLGFVTVKRRTEEKKSKIIREEERTSLKGYTYSPPKVKRHLFLLQRFKKKTQLFIEKEKTLM